MSSMQSTSERVAPNPAGDESAGLASERSYRNVVVRSAIALVAVLFVAWLIALLTGASGFGGLPGLADEDDPAPAQVEPAVPVGGSGTGAKKAAENRSSGAGSQAPTTSGGGQASPTTKPKARGGTRAGARGGAAPSTGSPGNGKKTGQPAVTPGGNVPNANSDGGKGNAYGSGRGGGKNKTG